LDALQLKLAKTYPYLSRNPSHVLENDRNILILAKYPFSYEVGLPPLPSSGSASAPSGPVTTTARAASKKKNLGPAGDGTVNKFKPFFVATFPGILSGSTPTPATSSSSSSTTSPIPKLILAAVHLTAGREGSTLAQKRMELAAIVGTLKEKYGLRAGTGSKEEYGAGDVFVVIGDTNLPSSSATTFGDEAASFSRSRDDAKSRGLGEGAVVEDVPRELADVGFVDCALQQHPEEDGSPSLVSVTYDPARNPLAAATSSKGLAERYDRVFVRNPSAVGTAECNLFGFGGEDGGVEVGSDHYGLRVLLRTTSQADASTPTSSSVISAPVTESAGISYLAAPPVQGASSSTSTLAPADQPPQPIKYLPNPTFTPHFPSLPVTHLTVPELVGVLHSEGFVPSEELEERMKRAVDVLRRVVEGTGDGTGASSSSTTTPTTSAGDNSGPSVARTTTAPKISMHLTPIGSYALKTHTSGSDIDTLAVGNLSSHVFWSVVRQRIRQYNRTVVTGTEYGDDMKESGAIKVRREVKTATVPRMELDIGGVKVDLGYCCAPGLSGAR
jgi:hypothetical protein